MSSDGFLVSRLIPPSVDGLLEGLDPALDNSLFPITAAQDLLNVRCSSGRWATRHGSGVELNIATPGSGPTRLFDVLYEADGGRFRLLARGENTGAALYDLEVGVDSAWQAVSGGAGLGTTTLNVPYFHGAQVGEAFYLSDRLNALKKYVTSGTLSAVTIPTAPTTAPRVKAWTYAVLEAWTGGGTLGWTESNSGRFDISDGTAAVSPPMGTGVGHIAIADPAQAGDTITKNVSGETLNSHTIAFWIYGSSSSRKWFQFGLGLTKADQFVEPQFVTKLETWWPVYMAVGNLPSINFKRFKVIFSPGETRDFYLSELFLPGRLQGFYRWGYTHYNPTTGHESGLSPISNDGEAFDFSAVGVSRNDGQAATKAFQKSAMLDFTSDSGTDAATTKIRIYRSGGVDTLTVGPDGRSTWLRVGEINDTATLLNGAHLLGATTLTLDSSAGMVAGDWLVVAKGTSTEEYVKVATVPGGTSVTLTSGLLSAQSDNATVQIAFLDNVGNEAIDVLSTVDEERDTAPAGAHWVQKAPDGRIWLFRYANNRSGVAVSNRPTPLRPNDQECFPDDVDPFTRASTVQGWRFGLGAEAAGEEIIWGGFFRGLPHVFTRNKCFRIHAHAQTDWGANAVQKALDRGCTGGHTVVQDAGYLYWVGEGPQVLRWDGEGPVEVLSDNRVNVRLEEAAQSAGTMDSTFWFAAIHETVFGRYYHLWFTFDSGLNGCLKRLDYNITHNLWEPCRWEESNGDTRAWNAAKVWDGGDDPNELIAVTARGAVIAVDVSSLKTDDGVTIPFLLKTKRITFGADQPVMEVREVYIRLDAVVDTANLTVLCGGSDYGDVTATYKVGLSGSGDADIRVPVERTLKGRWVELTLEGDFSNRPAIREMVVMARPLRERKTADS